MIKTVLLTLFVLIFGTLYRYMRGVDWGSNKVLRFLSGKYSYAAYVGLALGLIQQDWILGVITAIGMAILVSKSWSFLVLHGDKPDYAKDYPAIRDAFWWSKLINWYYPKTYRQKRLYGLMHMTLRGGIYILPMAIAYGVYAHSLFSLSITFVVGLLMGLVYYLVGFGYPRLQVKHAEMVYGLVLMGGLVAATVVV